MGSYNASILIGQSDIYHGGLDIHYLMFLWENDRPAWNLIGYETDKPLHRMVWIPSIDTMLEDGLTMIAAQVLKDEAVCSLLKKKFKNLKEVDLGKLPEKARDELRKSTRIAFAEKNMKLVITVLRGSSIASQLASLKDYAIDIDVCKAVKVRRSKKA